MWKILLLNLLEIVSKLLNVFNDDHDPLMRPPFCRFMNIQSINHSNDECSKSRMSYQQAQGARRSSHSLAQLIRIVEFLELMILKLLELSGVNRYNITDTDIIPIVFILIDRGPHCTFLYLNSLTVSSGYLGFL